MIAGVEYLLPSVSLGGAGSYSSAGAICPNLCVELYESCADGNWAAGARAAIQTVAALALVPRPISVVAEGRLRDHGTAGRPDPAAAADRIAGRIKFIEKRLEELGILQSEPHGW